MIKHAYILSPYAKLINSIQIEFSCIYKMLKDTGYTENVLFQAFNKCPVKVCPCNTDSIIFYVYPGKENSP